MPNFKNFKQNNVLISKKWKFVYIKFFLTFVSFNQQ
jgi:hypothetical protein